MNGMKRSKTIFSCFCSLIACPPETSGWLRSPRVRSVHQILFGAIFGLSLCVLPSSYGDESIDQTEAPYFWVPSMEEGGDPLPLKSTKVDIVIEGLLASVTVRQVYRNEGSVPLEASYVFPGSTRAAVSGLRFVVGDRTIEAKIQEKEQAKKTYETAKAEGKRTVLLEQHRPNVFQMKVANILPSDEVAVELVYTESLLRENGDYEFVFPTVVGPRYAGDPEAKSSTEEEWISSPYFATDQSEEISIPQFSLDLELVQGQGIQRAFSPSHELSIEFSDPRTARLSLENDGERNDNRDFILRYTLADEEPEVGVLITKTEDGGYFLVNLEPPARKPTRAAVPREYLFLLDVSGSMHGFPLDVSKKVMAGLIEGLVEGDSFNIITFAGASNVYSENGSIRIDSGTAHQEKRRAMNWINRLDGVGGTNLLPALQRTLKIPRGDGTARTVIVLTDGYVAVEQETFELIRNSLGEANLFAFGIGSSVNRHLIEGMARAGGGDEFVATNGKEAERVSSDLMELVRNPVLTDIDLQFAGVEVTELMPARQSDLFLERPVRVIGKFSGEWTGVATLTGKSGRESFERTVELGEMNTVAVDSLGLLWAREKVRSLSDELIFGNEDAIRKQIVALGLEYRLLTKFTSFVAVEEVVVRTEGNLVPVQQPSPLPAGVSSLAVGAGVPASPEPETIGLVLILGVTLGGFLWSSRKKVRK